MSTIVLPVMNCNPLQLLLRSHIRPFIDQPSRSTHFERKRHKGLGINTIWGRVKLAIWSLFTACNLMRIFFIKSQIHLFYYSWRMLLQKCYYFFATYNFMSFITFQLYPRPGWSKLSSCGKCFEFKLIQNGSGFCGAWRNFLRQFCGGEWSGKTPKQTFVLVFSTKSCRVRLWTGLFSNNWTFSSCNARWSSHRCNVVD